MPNCYHCGAHIKNGEGFRRNVLTSQSARVYSKGGGSYGQSYGLRTLCGECAISLDKRNTSASWRGIVSLIIALLFMIFAVRNRGEINSFLFAFLIFGGPGVIAFVVLGFLESSFNNSLSNELASGFEKQEEPDLLDQPDNEVAIAFGEIHALFRKSGIFLMRLYELEENLDGGRELIEYFFNKIPIKNHAELNEWSSSVFNEASSKFILEAKEALAYQNIEYSRCLANEISAEVYFDRIQRCLDIFEYFESDTHESYINRFKATVESFENGQVLTEKA